MPSKASWDAWNPGGRSQNRVPNFHYVMPSRYQDGWYCPKCDRVLKRRTSQHGLGKTSKIYPKRTKRKSEPFPYELAREIELWDAHIREM